MKAVLFDLDGVLVDAVKLHKDAFVNAVRKVSGVSIHDDFHESELNGLPTKTKLDLLVGRKIIQASHAQQISDLKQAETIGLIKRDIKHDPQKVALIRTLKADGIRVACVTNSIRDSALLMLQQIGVIGDLDLVISNQEVKYPKPHPEGYWKAMMHFGVMPTDTLIVEDAPKGIQAAKASGASVWQVSGPEQVTWMNLAKILADYKK